MAPSTADEGADRRGEAVRREMQSRRADDEPDDQDLVETVGDEQRRERAALEDDAADADEG